MGTITTVNFRSDTLFACERDDGVFVAVTPICTSLGLDAKKQRERIQRDPILSEGGAVMALPSPGGTQDTFCLRLDLVNGWLFTIDESRVRDEETKQRVLSYKRECYSVLFKHFYGRSFEQRRASLEEPIGEPRMEEPTQTRRQLVTEARQTHGIQAARELWFKLGLPTTPAMYADPSQGEFFYYTAIKRDAPRREDEPAEAA